MTANSTAKANGRSRSKGSSKPSPEAEGANTETQAASAEIPTSVDRSEEIEEENMATDNVVKITARPVQEEAGQKEGAIQLRQTSLTVWNRPVMPSDVEVVDTITVAGVRPIAASHLQVYASYLNGRPIAASNLKVAELLPGDRPIFESDFHAVEGVVLPGDRPIMVSDPKLLSASLLPGNRPIASNEIDDAATLMGFID
ncbi:MAG: hypothetical protein K6T90_14990 [Leptolyngbyaceae cyanobacterium HOT.MB2.61]|jgi:hypothetical protein|nr:hypothetical protein [Leptolyngbyaceae cyanobacterium HOT.MB2.61]